ncbi:MAG: universal stress protein [Rhodothermales bacterium]
MLNIKKILFPTDFSACAERAFTHAGEIATLFDAEIHAFHTRIKQADEYPALQHVLADLEEEDISSSSAAEQVIHPPKANHDLIIQADATDSSACNAILEYSEKHDIDLIVMGSHGRRGPRRLFLGSTAECVIRNAHCPVLTLRNEASTLEKNTIKHILIPMDFSSFSIEALRYANELARLWNAKISLVHAIEETIIPVVYGVEAMSFTSTMPLKDKSNKELKILADEYLDDDLERDIQTLIGNPANEITYFAEENAVDLILLASHGLTGFKRFLLGSVAQKLNRKAPCAVMTIKPFGKSLLEENNAVQAA